MSDTITRARALIAARLADLDAEARKLESALASMGERIAPRHGRPKATAAPAKAKPRAGRKRRGAKRAPKGQRREQLLAAVKANPGAGPSELAREMGVSANQVHGLIKKARADKLLVKKGNGYALKT